ncbi:hypothetical protein T484DRAFT_1859834 [Baffinella frigidus]|nr:hypothetical protein T484DRAFT_1859834 [Cryptophyta sp. CCMP2293]
MGDRLNEQQKAEAEEENQRRFMSWAKEMGVEAPNISPASFAGGLRGMRADKAIGAGEDLVTLPRTSALQVADREPCPFPGELSPLFWSEASLSVKLGVVLLREELLGAASSSAAYLAILPRAFDGSPCWWDPAELPQLQDPVLEEEVRETNRKLAAIHMELLAAARGKSVLRNATLDEFRWAMACVMSRSDLYTP